MGTEGAGYNFWAWSILDVRVGVRVFGSRVLNPFKHMTAWIYIVGKVFFGSGPSRRSIS